MQYRFDGKETLMALARYPDLSLWSRNCRR
ncbi:Arm DNA-binding domain-containing protein [Sphingomonas pituitosa]|nr:Arm DNA-binding domain-containing protein [Sphingomonas pituitosa]